MDPTAVWTALAVVTALLVAVGGGLLTVLLAVVFRLYRENTRLGGQLTDYLLRLTEADHARREAEQTAASLRADLEIQHKLRGGHR